MTALVARAQRVGGPIWMLLVALTVAVAHSPSFFHRLLDGDEAIYASIAALMNTGLRLYAEGGVDNKPPGIFWIYSLTFRVFGTYQMTAVHTVALLVVVATCGLIYVLARRIGGTRAGLFAALAYGIFTGAGYPRMGAANTELFMMLPLVASTLFLLDRRWVWAGAMLVFAGTFKQVAVANLLLVPVGVALLEPAGRRLRAGLEFAAGIAGSSVLVLSSVAATGSLPGMLHWTVGILGGYAAATWRLDQLWERLADSPLQFVETTAVLWLAAVWQLSRWRSFGAESRLLAVWLVAAMAGALAGGHMFGHYFIQVLGPLAALAGLGLDEALKTSAQRWVASAAVIGVALPLVGWTAYDFAVDPLTYDLGPRASGDQQLTGYIRDHTQRSDRIFVWGDSPALYVESDRMMSSRFPGFLRGFARGSGLSPDNWDTTPEVWNDLQSDLATNPPAVIVDTSTPESSDFSKYPISNYPVLAAFVAAGYEKAATVDGVDVYIRV